MGQHDLLWLKRILPVRDEVGLLIGRESPMVPLHKVIVVYPRSAATRSVSADSSRRSGAVPPLPKQAITLIGTRHRRLGVESFVSDHHRHSRLRPRLDHIPVFPGPERLSSDRMSDRNRELPVSRGCCIAAGRTSLQQLN